MGGFEGFDSALASLQADGPYDGVIRFSQGGEVAELIDARWVVCFSAVAAPLLPSPASLAQQTELPLLRRNRRVCAREPRYPSQVRHMQMWLMQPQPWGAVAVKVLLRGYMACYATLRAPAITSQV